MEISYNKFALRLLWGKIWEQKISVSTIPYPNYVKAKVIDWFLHTLSLSRHTHFSFVYERREKNEKRIVENIAQNHSTCRLLRIFCWQHKNKIKNWLTDTFSMYSRSNFNWNRILIRIRDCHPCHPSIRSGKNTSTAVLCGVEIAAYAHSLENLISPKTTKAESQEKHGV